MSSGPSLYRRHRPRTFADVVGQEHVVRTLRNAVQRGQVHHAYLFVGSRGTGKTSMAKILAACLNCERGPTVEPCGVCQSCTAIASATSLDVIEMDAASNNSVDDIRDLRDRVGYAPVSGRHKVYILDEAHMLSPQAWNAFLKTLEEPPPSTVFVLATTEAQKVLPTVVDRCHRFDFARPSVGQIAAVLRRTADSEGIEVPDAALGLLARSATGSFRDALGTLEQLVVYGGETIGIEDVLAVLGAADDDLVFGALDAVAARDARAALHASARLAEAGRDAGQLFRDLEAHARELLVVGLLEEVPPELRVTPERDARLLDQAGRVARADVVRLLDLLATGIEAGKAGASAGVQLELALVKAAAPDVDPSTRALLARIDRLEARLGGGSPVAAAPAPSTSSPTASAPESPPLSPSTAAAPPPASLPVAAAPASPGAETPAPPGAPGAAGTAAETAAAVARPPIAPADELAPDLSAVRELWPAVVDAVRAENAMLAALLAGARPVELAGARVTVAFPEGAAFLKRKAESESNRARAVQALRAVTGQDALTLAYELREGVDAQEQAAAPGLSDDELMARLVAAFDAEEIPVTDEQEGGAH